MIYLQAKRWEGTVGRPEIQKFVGALHGRRARKGVFITTSSFSAEAVSYVQTIDPKVALVDGKQLAEYMIDFDLGVSPVRAYEVKQIHSDYFEEDLACESYSPRMAPLSSVLSSSNGTEDDTIPASD
jgi:restriction system protein